MCMGEGKMLIVMLVVYLNVLFGKGVYIVMVNDYLVKCDVEINWLFFEFLGMIVGVNIFNML